MFNSQHAQHLLSSAFNILVNNIISARRKVILLYSRAGFMCRIVCNVRRGQFCITMPASGRVQAQLWTDIQIVRLLMKGHVSFIYAYNTVSYRHALRYVRDDEFVSILRDSRCYFILCMFFSSFRPESCIVI